MSTMANMDATHAGAGAQLSFPDEPPAFIDNNIDIEHGWPEPLYFCAADDLPATWLGETQFFRDALIDPDLDNSDTTIAPDDVSCFDAPGIVPHVKHELPRIKTEETKPTLHVNCNTFQQPWNTEGLTPTSPNPGLTPTSPNTSPLTLQRTSSKRQRPTNNDASTETKTKRTKAEPNGFPCLSCQKPFDRLCDLTKHQKHKHGSKTDRAHECPQTDCTTRFCWRKDVRRHLKQVHKFTDDDIPQYLKQVQKASPAVLLSPASERRHSTAWLMKKALSMTKALSMFKKLHLKAKSPEAAPAAEKFVMVTWDKRSFVEVDVTYSSSANDLQKSICEAFGLERQAVRVAKYHRTSGFEKVLSDEALVEVVRKGADAEGRLKLQVSF